MLERSGVSHLFGTEEVRSRLPIERMGRIFLNELGLSRSFIRERKQVGSRFHIERFGGRTDLSKLSKLFTPLPSLEEVNERLKNAGKIVADGDDIGWIISNPDSPETHAFKNSRLRFVFFGAIGDTATETRVWYLRWTKQDGFSEGSLPIYYAWHHMGRIVLKRPPNELQTL